MNAYAFDSLDFYEQLTAAGMPEKQAKTQANAFKYFFALKSDKEREELATKGDMRESELRLQKEIELTRAEIKETELRLQKEIEIVRGEVEKVRGEIKETELRLHKEINNTKYALLRWQIAGWLGLGAIMAKGFGWLGF